MGKRRQRQRVLCVSRQDNRRTKDGNSNEFRDQVTDEDTKHSVSTCKKGGGGGKRKKRGKKNEKA